MLLSLLIDGSIQWKSYGYQGPDHWQSIVGELQKAWREFIAAHRQALREGRRFEAVEPPLSRAMFPPGFQFSPPGKPPWPDWGP